MAKLLSLGLDGLEVGQVSQPWNVPVGPRQAPGQTPEVGATGTPIFSGFLRELGEYNPNLTWPAAYMVYEQMRRGDAMVAATLMAPKVLIRGAEWDVRVDDDASPVEKEACEFAKSCLFEELNFRGGPLDNALLMLDFGASMHEDVWYVDGNASRVRLKKLAPRLPLTWFRWLCKPGTDELETVEQLGYRAGSYIRTDVPLSQATLFTYRQEGANFTGRSMCREMYPHWYTKWNLYKIDAIACERNGMGVPVVTMGEASKTAGASYAEDRANAMKWVQQLTVNERTGVVLPPGGWTFKLEGVTGTLRDPKDAIEHHNVMIAMAGLSPFLLLGHTSGSSGNRSLGQEQTDFWFMSLQAIADYIASQMSQTTVKRLVDLNFEGVEKYPQLVAQNILSVNFQDVVEALKGLALSTVDAVRPDDELEDWLRKKIGAPKRGAPRLRVAAPTPAPGEETGGDARRNPDAEAQAGAEAGSGGGEGSGSGAVEKGQKNAKSGDSSGAKQVIGADGVKLSREPRGPEKFLAAAEIVGRLDRGRDEVAAALRAARGRVQAEIVHKLVDKPIGQAHQVWIPLDEKLRTAVREVLQDVAAFGREQVAAERDRQMAGRKAPDASQVRSVVAAEKGRDQVGLFADGVVSEYQNNLQARAANVALDKQRQGGKTKGEMIQEIGEDLDDQSDKWIDKTASKGANEAFGAGRQEGYEQCADEIGETIYSALLDLNTCENCAAADGASGKTPDDIPAVPNPDCDGGALCRCVHVFVFSDEARGKA